MDVLRKSELGAKSARKKSKESEGGASERWAAEDMELSAAMAGADAR